MTPLPDVRTQPCSRDWDPVLGKAWRPGRSQLDLCFSHPRLAAESCLLWLASLRVTTGSFPAWGLYCWTQLLGSAHLWGHPALWLDPHQLLLCPVNLLLYCLWTYSQHLFGVSLPRCSFPEPLPAFLTMEWILGAQPRWVLRYTVCLFVFYVSLKIEEGDFPCGAVVKTLHSQCRQPSSIPGQGTRSHMHATTKEPTCCNQDPVQPNK